MFLQPVDLAAVGPAAQVEHRLPQSDYGDALGGGFANKPMLMPWRKHRQYNPCGSTRFVRAALLVIVGIGLIAVGWLSYRPTARALKVIPRNIGDGLSEMHPGPYAARTLYPELSRPQRPVYPYSVIPGGVQNVHELRDVVLRDPVVAAHYARFNVSRSRILELQVGRSAYVSYRIKNGIFWTSRRIRLFPGERVITDGVNYARARCGNRISEVPLGEQSAHEPAQAELESPLAFTDPAVIPAVFTSVLQPFALSPTPPPGAGSKLPQETAWFVPVPFALIAGATPFFVPKGGGSAPTPSSSGVVIPGASAPTPSRSSDPLPSSEVGRRPPHPPATAVPEPGTLLLVSTGLGLTILHRRRRMRG